MVIRMVAIVTGGIGVRGFQWGPVVGVFVWELSGGWFLLRMLLEWPCPIQNRFLDYLVTY